MSIRISPLRQTTLRRTTYEPTTAAGITSGHESASSAYSRPSLATHSYNSPSYTSTSKYGRGSTAAADTASSFSRNGDEDEFPYLREFSKRLSTLKAEPIYKRNVPLSTSATSRTTTSSNTASLYTSRASYSRPIMTQRESHWYDPVAQFFARMEEKYALKKKILILVVLLMIIFVAVMFYSN